MCDDTKLLGVLGGAREYPVTRAPKRFSHSASHDPLNPVCPVRNTARSRSASTKLNLIPTPSTARALPATNFPAGACHAACPCIAKIPHAGKPPTARGGQFFQHVGFEAAILRQKFV